MRTLPKWLRDTGMCFVNIHPFEDGNGRMCRMLLNVVLLKFIGVCVAIVQESRIGLITWL